MRSFWLVVLALLVLGSLAVSFRMTTEAPAMVSAVQEAVPEIPVALELTERILELSDGTTTSFRLASDFDIAIAAEGLGKARFMAFAPDGRLFVPDMVNYNLSRDGRLHVLSGFDPVTKRFTEKHEYLSGLRTPNSVAFFRDEDGQDWLYLALTAHLVRYPYKAGDTKPSGPAEIITEFPNEQSPGEVSVVWHITRTILFHDDRIYVSVGSGCNACEQLAGDMRAMVYSMKPDGSDARIEGDGLRNTVGIEFAEGKLYATGNGVDHLGPDAPNETLYNVEGGRDYGWPYCYSQDGKMVLDDSYVWEDPMNCDEVPLPLTNFPPRSAPLGIRYFGANAHPALAQSFLVALHGSFEAEMRSGNQIMRVTPEGEQTVFMDGFQAKESDERWARPVDILPFGDGFFFSDDEGGRVFYVYPR